MDECEPDAKTDLETMQDAAVDAVENAVRHAEDNGFSHEWADILSIGFVDAVLYEEERKTWTKTNVVLLPVSRRPAR